MKTGTYTYLREDGTPVYVGKGPEKRAHDATGHRGLTPENRDRIILQEHPSEADAFEAEVFLISFYGRKDRGTGCLRNLTDGGEGSSGSRPSAETRRKMSETHKRILKVNPRPPRPPASLETRAKLRAARLGKVMSAESILKCSEAKKGRVFSPEHRESMSRVRKGKPIPWLPHGRKPGYAPSPKTRAKISEALKMRAAAKRIA
jgi:hypothetical protein